jgi:spore coat protein A, manganese oxidase
MQSRVSSEKTGDGGIMPAKLRTIPRISETTAVATRELTLADYQNRLGRSNVMLLNGAHWNTPVTEKPVLDSTKIWSFVDLTDASQVVCPIFCTDKSD